MARVEFDKKVKCNSKFVAVRYIENSNDLKVGNIYVTDSYEANGRLAIGIIEDVGDFAAKEYGLEVGQYVYFDRLATFCHTEPVAVLEYNSIICLTNRENTVILPLKGMMIVEPDNTDPVSNVGGIYVLNYAEKLNTGVITAVNFTDEVKDKFKIGDRVLLTKGPDTVFINGKTIYIYKEDMLVCRIED